ncbi:efflux RND transporter permease subunit [Micrococcus terreus]|uniref:Hydrophobic/amphiphilic exporter-1, HAE1 family n=1 Tax=Micrococcus terreus TaxID=574650 RepID=A0A1I7MGV9_9MICC|nr:efflux RND transporter permease subunit [Micrococcus terreus]SFV21154.1 hydrophobic/amphiphilic exporter-1, HAE1 family [Micrococcus terreus]
MGALARFSLANRALIALITVFTAVFGVLLAGQLKQELIPSLEFPVVSVTTTMPGATPEVVDRQVGEPLETALQAVEHLESSTSTSATGLNTIALRFDYGTDLNRARSQVDRAVSNVSGQLPEDTQTSSFAGSVSDFPVIFMAVSGGETGLNELRSEIERLAVPRLQKLDGVRGASVTGGTEQHISILPDDDAMADAGLTVADIRTALEENAGLFPIGQIPEGSLTLPIQAGAPIETLEDLRQVAVIPSDDAAQPASDGSTAAPGTAPPSAPDGGAAPTRPDEQQSPAAPTPPAAGVLLGELATVELADDVATSITRTDGVDTLGLAVTKTPDADTVSVSQAVRELVPELEALLGSDAAITVVFDQAPFIEQSIQTLVQEGILGLGFAVLVILVFLASVRSTLVTAVSIPLSLLVTLIGMRVSDYSLNMLTLGALTISIGRVVDDSIVVVENIKRHLAADVGKKRAILDGTAEVATAITSSTLATVAVFAPVALVGGMAGELFRPFAVTMSIALLASLFVALTIVPVLCWWFLGHQPRTQAQHRAEPTAAADGSTETDPAPGTTVTRRLGPMQKVYRPVLRVTQRRPGLTLVAAALLLGATVAAVPLVPTNLLGDTGQNTFTVTATQPAGTSLETTAEAADQVDEVLRGIEGVHHVQWTAGSAGFIPGMRGASDEATFTVLTDPEVDQQLLQQQARDQLAELTGVGEVRLSAAGGMGMSSDIEVRITAPSPELLTQADAVVRESMATLDGAQEVSSNLSQARPTVQVTVDRAATSEAGLTEEQVALQVAAALNPVPAGSIRLGYTDYPVQIGDPAPVESTEDLSGVEVMTGSGPRPLDELAEVSREEVLATVTSTNGDRTAVVSVTPADDDLGALSGRVSQTLEGLDLPEGTSAELGGAATQQQESFNDLYLALLAAVAIVYVIMVATFRSLIQPLVLLVSIPFATTGAIALLLVTGSALGLPSLIGFLMLVGVVVTNAIVLIDLINQYRRIEGMDLDTAIERGALNRLRPIVMTALATILALVPMALGITGHGGFISQPLAIVVVGGLVSSTVLTLVLVPVLYRLVEGFGQRRRERLGLSED